MCTTRLITIVYGVWQYGSFCLGWNGARLSSGLGNLLAGRAAVSVKTEGGDRNHCQSNAADQYRFESPVPAEPRDKRGQGNGEASDRHPLVKCRVGQKGQPERRQIGDHEGHRGAVDGTPDRRHHSEPITPAVPIPLSGSFGAGGRHVVDHG